MDVLPILQTDQGSKLHLCVRGENGFVCDVLLGSVIQSWVIVFTFQTNPKDWWTGQKYCWGRQNPGSLGWQVGRSDQGRSHVVWECCQRCTQGTYQMSQTLFYQSLSEMDEWIRFIYRLGKYLLQKTARTRRNWRRFWWHQPNLQTQWRRDQARVNRDWLRRD